MTPISHLGHGLTCWYFGAMIAMAGRIVVLGKISDANDPVDLRRQGQSIEDLGQAEKAHWSLDVGRADRDRGAIAVFLSFYVVCAAIAWFSYQVCNGRADRCTRVIYAPKSAR